MFKTLEIVDKIKQTLDAEGEEKVRQGISGYHHESILKHPHKELAETLAKITPIYARAPQFTKPFLRG